MKHQQNTNCCSFFQTGLPTEIWGTLFVGYLCPPQTQLLLSLCIMKKNSASALLFAHLLSDLLGWKQMRCYKAVGWEHLGFVFPAAPRSICNGRWVNKTFCLPTLPCSIPFGEVHHLKSLLQRRDQWDQLDSWRQGSSNVCWKVSRNASTRWQISAGSYLEDLKFLDWKRTVVVHHHWVCRNVQLFLMLDMPT